MPVGFGTRPACYTSALPRSSRNSKKGTWLHQVNQALLAALHPEQVEVEICRADELKVRRGLASELSAEVGAEGILDHNDHRAMWGD